jgi:ribonucleoside-diphosphate reductase alpha chain
MMSDRRPRGSYGGQVPPQAISRDVLAEKYLYQNEHTADEVFIRVSRALASVEHHTEQDKMQRLFLANLRRGAIGAGRIMHAAGTGLQSTLLNCFVLPIGDCDQGADRDGLPGIAEALRESAETLRQGGGVGVDFSRIRPRGAEADSTSARASGPCEAIDLFDRSCADIESGRARRGAQMGVLRIDHPDVIEFITAKKNPGRWRNFNVSVAISDQFMDAIGRDAPWPLIHRARPGMAAVGAGARQRQEDGLWVYQTVSARGILELLTETAYDTAEPGVLFIDTINKSNNLRYCESIESTNPCGEQPLPPYGSCDLGPLILPKFVINPFGKHGQPALNFAELSNAVGLQVRMLDNALDLTTWPLQRQRQEALSKRRIGVGFTGLGDALIMLGLRYDRREARTMAEKIARHMRDAAYNASIALAQEKGAFPMFDPARYLAEGTFASKLPQSLKRKIAKFGIRNSHLLSIAPAGTVSLAFADNTSNGIEPAYGWTYMRRKRNCDCSYTTYEVENYAWRLYQSLFGPTDDLPEFFLSALEITPTAQLQMMTAVQKQIDSAISKTMHLPEQYPVKKVQALYMQAWKAGLKGLTVYRAHPGLDRILVSTDRLKPPASIC